MFGLKWVGKAEVVRGPPLHPGKLMIEEVVVKGQVV
jgi:hypothetical protein